jgi:aspartyl-tRNA(Asn)/glutamyl-tRNA(Gln) amidotransferase subunit A
VPATIKENIATRGDPMPAGTAAVDLKPATADAPPAARLKEAGAVIVSKTTMPDYGMLSSGLSSFHKLARNPWDLGKTPGGSSAGAGAATAAGYGPLHLGTDIGGSLRLPASWCGIFTLKPSLGRIPIDPPYMGRAAGPMTRTVGRCRADDAGALEARRARQHEPAGAGHRLGRFDVSPDHLRGLRIGLLLDAGCGLAVEPEIQRSGRTRRAPVRESRRGRRTDAALHVASHARRHGPPVAHALAGGHEGAARRPARQGAALHP